MQGRDQVSGVPSGAALPRSGPYFFSFTGLRVGSNADVSSTNSHALWRRVDWPGRPCYTPPHREARVLNRGAVFENQGVFGEGVPG